MDSHSLAGATRVIEKVHPCVLVSIVQQACASINHIVLTDLKAILRIKGANYFLKEAFDFLLLEVLAQVIDPSFPQEALGLGLPITDVFISIHREPSWHCLSFLAVLAFR